MVTVSAVVFLLVIFQQSNPTHDLLTDSKDKSDSSEIQRQLESSSPLSPSTQGTSVTTGELTLVATQQTKQTEINPNFLPPSVLDRIKSFLFFVGHARSGHSIVGAVLDSHPHVVIAHEEDLFHKLVDVYKDYSKSQIFNTLWNNSYMSAIDGLRTHTDQARKKGYTLAIDGLYQGKYQSYIDVIGDKRGGFTADMMAKNFSQWESVFLKLKSTVGLPMKVIRVIRNPYDNIATIILIKCREFIGKVIKEIKESDKIISCNHPDLVDDVINSYFESFQGVERVKAKYNLDIIEVHGQNLTANPRKVISELCSFLQITCDDNFLNICSSKIFPTESKTRYKLKWREEQILKIKRNIERFDSLRRYKYNS